LNYFITVNYGTSNLIKVWASSIRKVSKDAALVLVDNFKSECERDRVKSIVKDLDIHFIESENVGYGQSLNKAIDYCFDLEGDRSFNIFAGNLDIEYKSFSLVKMDKKCVYIPTIQEVKNKNRNPFLTHLQKKNLYLYLIPAYFKSAYLLYFAVGVTKVIGKIPSKIWAVHGSVFCFNSECINKREYIFNEDSFLYCEELEFASYMEKNKVAFIEADIFVVHNANASTHEIKNSRKRHFEIWRVSFLNWLIRWK
jgi:hypothetical protein